LPISDVLVTAYNATGADENEEIAFTDANGNYQITQNLATGLYNVSVEYEAGYMDEILSGISVTAEVMTNNVNFALAASGVITGTVTNAASGADLSDI